MSAEQRKNPTDPFTISEPQDQEIGEFYVVQERWLWKSRSGSSIWLVAYRFTGGESNLDLALQSKVAWQ